MVSTAEALAAPAVRGPVTTAQRAAMARGDVDAVSGLVAERPHDPATWVALGLSEMRAGRIAEATGHFEHAVRLRRNHVPHLLGLAECYRKGGRLDEAADTFRRALDLEPGRVEARIALGQTEIARGREAEGKALVQSGMQQALKAKKTRAARPLVSKVAGLAAVPGWLIRREGPLAAARCVAAAAALQRRGDVAGAIIACQEATECDPANIPALILLGRLYAAREQHQSAADALMRARALGADELPVLVDSAMALRRAKRWNEAQETADLILGRDDGNVDALVVRGWTWFERGEMDRARDDFARAAERAPDNAQACYGLARVAQAEGDRDATAAWLDRTVAADPSMAIAYYSKSRIGRLAAAGEHVAALERLAGNPALGSRARSFAHFALANVREKQDDMAAAFAHYRDANALRDVIFDPAEWSGFVDRVSSVHDRALIERLQAGGSDSETPVFIIGMPRSGTSLVEQILASHPGVHGAGELETARRIVDRAAAEADPDRPYPEGVAAFDGTRIASMAAAYLDDIRARGGDAARITDKMPHNFVIAGLVAAMFPRGRIIHCRRDPMDTCWSIYRLEFAGDHNYAYDLENLGHYYAGYRRLMAHWRSVLPQPMLEVDYEAIVDDQEGTSRRLVEFCGLDWDDSCLAFHENARTVRTNSLNQVRRPIYRSSVGGWRRCERELAPLVAALREGGVEVD